MYAFGDIALPYLQKRPIFIFNKIICKAAETNTSYFLITFVLNIQIH